MHPRPSSGRRHPLERSDCLAGEGADPRARPARPVARARRRVAVWPRVLPPVPREPGRLLPLRLPGGRLRDLPVRPGGHRRPLQGGAARERRSALLPGAPWPSARSSSWSPCACFRWLSPRRRTRRGRRDRRASPGPGTIPGGRTGCRRTTPRAAAAWSSGAWRSSSLLGMFNMAWGSDSWLLTGDHHPLRPVRAADPLRLVSEALSVAALPPSGGDLGDAAGVPGRTSCGAGWPSRAACGPRVLRA